MKLFVYHIPQLTPTDKVPDCAIAIDVLRATTTIATALNAGAEAVQTFSEMDKLMHVSEQWPSEQRLRAGEREGEMVAGCDLGNSPLDCTPQRVQGRRLFISTTNGTRALQSIHNAPIVLAAAIVNRLAIVDYIVAQQPATVWLVASGWRGRYSLEDTACAGAIAHSLGEKLNKPWKELVGNDETVAAISLYRQWQDQLLELFHHANHGQRLLNLGCHEDVNYCAQPDILDVLPIQTEPGVFIKKA